MRLNFMFIVLLITIIWWQFIEHQVRTISKEVLIKKVLPMDVPYERVQAYTYLNDIRKSMQMQRLQKNDFLDRAAQAHADYLVLNNEKTHEERAGDKNFTGISPRDRAFYAGYQSSFVSENISTQNYNARSSVDGLLSAIYHRFVFLSPSIDEIGVGVTQDKKQSQRSAFVYLIGNSALDALCKAKSFNRSGKYIYGVCKEHKHRIKESTFYEALNYNKQLNPKIILYPYNGQEEVPPAFYAEVPDPLPDYDVSGFPISIEFNGYFFHKIKMHSFKLYIDGAGEVKDVRLMDQSSDPHNQFTAKQYALFPLQRLEFNTLYRVEIEYLLKGRKELLIWYFQTQKYTEMVHTVTQKEESLSIESGKSHIIYFRPLDAQDIIYNIKFPSNVDIQFIDNNTIKLTLMSDEIDQFDIQSDTRRLHIKVK